MSGVDPMADHREATRLHANVVSWRGRGALVTGPSGSGKSALSLSLMALGADLVADDAVLVLRRGDTLCADAPAAIRGLIEARGVGLLHARAVGPVQLHVAIDMGIAETARLPPFRGLDILGLTLPVLHKVESRHFPAAILQYLKLGRRDPASPDEPNPVGSDDR